MSPEGRRDPYPLYAALRAHGPALALDNQLIVTSYHAADRADRAATQLCNYFIGLVADRRQTPADDLTSELAAAAKSADSVLSGAELVGNLALLLLAGHR